MVLHPRVTTEKGTRGTCGFKVRRHMTGPCRKDMKGPGWRGGVSSTEIRPHIQQDGSMTKTRLGLLSRSPCFAYQPGSPTWSIASTLGSEVASKDMDITVEPTSREALSQVHVREPRESRHSRLGRSIQGLRRKGLIGTSIGCTWRGCKCGVTST